MSYRLEGVTKDYAALKKKYQSLSAVPKGEVFKPFTKRYEMCWSVVSAGSIIDGSGAVTGLAFHQLRHEMEVTKAEKDELNKKYVKIKHETEKERYEFLECLDILKGDFH